MRGDRGGTKEGAHCQSHLRTKVIGHCKLVKTGDPHIPEQTLALLHSLTLLVPLGMRGSRLTPGLLAPAHMAHSHANLTHNGLRAYNQPDAERDRLPRGKGTRPLASPLAAPKPQLRFARTGFGVSFHPNKNHAVPLGTAQILRIPPPATPIEERAPHCIRGHLPPSRRWCPRTPSFNTGGFHASARAPTCEPANLLCHGRPEPGCVRAGGPCWVSAGLWKGVSAA